MTSELRQFLRHNPIRPGRDSCVARTALERHTIHIEDTLADPEYSWGAKDVEPIRTVLGVPLLRGGELLGVIVLYKHVVRPFTDKQIDLVTTFADQAVIAIENTRLLSELRESLQQQTATADVLKVISQSTFDLQAVLDTLVELATRLCDADHTFFFQRDGEHFRWSASYGHETDVHAKLEDYFRTRSVPADRGSVTGRTALVAKVVHVTDVLADPEYTWSGAQEIGGWRAALGVPLLRKGDVVGVLFIAKTVPQPFTAKQIELAVTFADQAVIAIENTRLLKELRELLLQQTATAEVLKVISRSAFDLQAVLDTLVKSATQLCEADIGQIARRNEAGVFQMQAHFGFSTELKDEVERIAFKPGRGGIIGRALLERTTIQIVDAETDPEYKFSKSQSLGGYHSMIGTPLLREGTPIGAFGLARKVVRPFTDMQMALLTTFADQAAIAIENTRLLNELRESLQQQTATADLLKVISQSTFQLQPVFDAIARTASRLCNAEFAVFLMFREGKLHLVASNNATDAVIKYASEHPIAPGRDFLVGRTFVEGNTVHIPDCLADPEYALHEYQAIGRYRSMLGVPLLREGTPIGVIGLLRTVVMPFTERQIDLVKTFADQAVIAIENAHLFEEVQARTGELSEALRQQTATADVLQVISRSAFDLQPVFDTVAESSVKLCEAERALIWRYDGKLLRMVAGFNSPPEFKEWCAQHPILPGRHTAAARAALDRRTVHITDVRADPEYSYGAKDVEPVRTVLSGKELARCRTLRLGPFPAPPHQNCS